MPDTDDDKTPASLKALRVIYREAYAKLVVVRTANFQVLTAPLDKRLAQMESDFTKSDRLADALTVRGYREALKESTTDLKVVSATATPSATTPSQNGPKSSTTLAPAATLALKDGITNTLGMKFVPVKGTAVMFCIHEVRHQDCAAYAAEAPGVDSGWKDQSADGYTPTDNKEQHPVVRVSWEDAQKFCAWLSKKEGKTYRLPTDEEWSYAVGIGTEEKRPKGTTPEMLSGKIRDEFPWGKRLPPPNGNGNYADAAYHEKFPSKAWINDYADNFVTTAPVMSFKPNKLGLYDLGGNVWEWVEDSWNEPTGHRVIRGASFQDDARGLHSSNRFHAAPNLRFSDRGFRCVLVVQ